MPPLFADSGYWIALMHPSRDQLTADVAAWRRPPGREFHANAGNHLPAPVLADGAQLHGWLGRNLVADSQRTWLNACRTVLTSKSCHGKTSTHGIPSASVFEMDGRYVLVEGIPDQSWGLNRLCRAHMVMERHRGTYPAMSLAHDRQNFAKTRRASPRC